MPYCERSELDISLIPSFSFCPVVYMVCADFASYCDTRDRLNREFYDEDRFASMRIMNIAGAGYFSSDRSVGEYAKRIWGIK